MVEDGERGTRRADDEPRRTPSDARSEWAARLGAERRRAAAQARARRWRWSSASSRSRARVSRCASPTSDGRALGPSGSDEVEFYLAANPGEEPRPLARVASGGELSRIMLALKTLMAGDRDGATLIFDEVDAGIGGARGGGGGLQAPRARTAPPGAHGDAPAGDRGVRRASRRGDEARPSAGGPFPRASPLSDSERVDELARMLGGARRTPRGAGARRAAAAHGPRRPSSRGLKMAFCNGYGRCVLTPRDRFDSPTGLPTTRRY